MRKIKYSVFNESKVIAFAVSIIYFYKIFDYCTYMILLSQIYNVVFFSVIIVILQYTNASDRTILFIIRSVGIFLATGAYFSSRYTVPISHTVFIAISVGSIFLSKFGNLKADPFTQSTRSSHTNIRPTSNSSKDSELKYRYDMQQKRISELEEENIRLKSLVEQQSRAPISVVEVVPISEKEQTSSEKNSSSSS